MSPQTTVNELAQRLLARELMLVTAESCTGGLIAAQCTDLPGSSRWFERGLVTYSNQAKIELLDVPEPLIHRHGAVSREVVEAMAAGALANTAGADLSVSVTGIAGPSGGSPDKPVGTVWFAWGLRERALQSAHYQFDGDRESIRARAVTQAISGLFDLLDTYP